MGTGVSDLPPECLDLVLSNLRVLRPQLHRTCIRLTCKEWLHSYRRISTSLTLQHVEHCTCEQHKTSNKICTAMRQLNSSLENSLGRYPGLVNLKIDQNSMKALDLGSRLKLADIAWRSVEVTSAEYHQLKDIYELPSLLKSSQHSLRKLSLQCGSGDYTKRNPLSVHETLQVVFNNCRGLRHISLAHIDLSCGGNAHTSSGRIVGLLCAPQVVSVNLKGAIVGTDLCCIGKVFPNMEELCVEDTNMDEVAVHRKLFYSREWMRREALEGFVLEKLRVLKYKLKLRSRDYEAHWALYTKEALKGRVPNLRQLCTDGHPLVIPMLNQFCSYGSTSAWLRESEWW
jgi:hypothetical protein